MPDVNNNQNQFNNGIWNGPFMDAINIVSFLIGLQNLQLNVTSADLDKTASRILDEIHNHLKEQDDHLLEQDVHLQAQDAQLKTLELLVSDRKIRYGGKEEN